MNAEKTMAKVANNAQGSHKRASKEGPSDFCHFYQEVPNIIHWQRKTAPTEAIQPTDQGLLQEASLNLSLVPTISQ